MLSKFKVARKECVEIQIDLFIILRYNEENKSTNRDLRRKHRVNPYIKNLKKIEFIVTMACTGKCKHCSEGDHIGFTEHIDKEVAAEAVRKICSCYDISTVMTFGGEPLLYPETVCAIQKTATSLGVAKRQVITNGFFFKG